MDSAYLHAIIVWGALGLAVACLVHRMGTVRPPPGRRADALGDGAPPDRPA